MSTMTRAEILPATTDNQSFLLKRIQPALSGLMDGSLSTLAPIFAVMLATQRRDRRGGRRRSDHHLAQRRPRHPRGRLTTRPLGPLHAPTRTTGTRARGTRATDH
jgi:hypothetical protein